MLSKSIFYSIMNSKITEHFTLNEMTRSAALEEFNKSHNTNHDNIPTTVEIEANLHHLCMQLEWLRAIIGCPLTISSGYRSKYVNDLVGGSKTSLHKKGLAADVIIPLNKIPQFVTEAMNMPYTKEVFISHKTGTRSTWVHLGVSTETQDNCRVGIDVNGKVSACVHFKH